MSLRIRVIFAALFAALWAGALYHLVHIALLSWKIIQVEWWRRERMMGNAVGGVVLCGIALGLLAFFRSAVEEPYVVSFRRYLLRILAMAVRKGHSLGHALLALAQDFDGPRRKAVYRILSALDEGKPLSDALERGAGRFMPPNLVALVRSAEGGGHLASALEAALEESLEDTSYRSRILRASLYPLAIFSVGAFTALTVLPQFANIFGELVDARGRPLEVPRVTRFAIGVGEFEVALLQYAAVAALLLLPLRIRRVREAMAGVLDPLLLRLPVLGRLGLLRCSERVCRTLASLVRSGATLEVGLGQAGAASGNLAVRRSAEAAAEALRGGAPPHQALAGLRLPLFVRARAAAATGGTPERFAAALEGLAAECQWRKNRMREMLAGSVYPATLVVASLYVGLIYLGVFFPILKVQAALM